MNRLIKSSIFAVCLLAIASNAWAQIKTPPVSGDAYLQPEPKDFLVGVDSPTASVDKPISKHEKANETPNGISFESTQVIAIVAGEPIFLGDMLPEINATLERLLEGAPPEVKEREMKNGMAFIVPKFIPKYVDSKLLYRDAVEQLPDTANLEKILEQAAKDFDEKALPKILEKSKLNSPIEYDAQLRSRGSSLRKMRQDWAKEQLTGYFVNQSLKYDKEVTHEELLSYYNAHEEDYKVEAQVRWEELMIRFDQYSTRDEAHKAIVELGNRVVYGAKFEEVAKTSSHGLTSSKGGQYDWTKRGSLVDKKLEDTLFSIPLNELSEMIETNQGVHIVRVVERKQDGKVPFSEAQAKIKETIIEQNRNQAYETHINRLRKEIPYEVLWEKE